MGRIHARRLFMSRNPGRFRVVRHCTICVSILRRYRSSGSYGGMKMRTSILTAFALAALVAGVSVVRADEFGGQQQSNAAASTYLDQQAKNSTLSDPTAPNSIRSHGNR